MDAWTLENVIFVATDPFGSKEISLDVTFTVIPISFQIDVPDVTVVKDGESVTFSGVGLPGKTVTALINKVPANNTVVNSDSTWSLDIHLLDSMKAQLHLISDMLVRTIQVVFRFQ